MGDMRSELKHFILKQVVFRLDYDGILEADIEKCVIEFRQKIYEAGFDKMSNRFENENDFQNRRNMNVPDEVYAKNTVYSFLSEKKEILELSKNFLTLSVDADGGYTSFDKYSDLLVDLIDVIKNASPYFHGLRIGLRKINICYLSNLNLVRKYFTDAAFNMSDLLSQFVNYECNANNMVTVLMKDGYQINYARNIQEGIMEQENEEPKTLYQLILDIDVLNENRKEIAKMLSQKEDIKNALVKQNKIEFDIFIRSLTDDFISKLRQKIFSDDCIEGVI